MGEVETGLFSFGVWRAEKKNNKIEQRASRSAIEVLQSSRGGKILMETPQCGLEKGTLQ